ncbi:hypothetical protein VTO73DRAFT_9205 [Trametes versicolor]
MQSVNLYAARLPIRGPAVRIIIEICVAIHVYMYQKVLIQVSPRMNTNNPSPRFPPRPSLIQNHCCASTSQRELTALGWLYTDVYENNRRTKRYTEET